MKNVSKLAIVQALNGKHFVCKNGILGFHFWSLYFGFGYGKGA
jgi:hypothetical protein